MVQINTYGITDICNNKANNGLFLIKYYNYENKRRKYGLEIPEGFH